MTIAQIAKRAVHSIDINSPIILTGLAVAGVVSTVIFAIRTTPEAIRTIGIRQAQRSGNGTIDTPDPTIFEELQWTWKMYIPTAGMGVATICCIIGAQSINSRRQAALISGFTLAETSFREYREKVAELNGPKANEKVRDSIAQDRVSDDSSSSEVVIIGNGNVLCYDMYTGRYFESQMETIRSAQNTVNERIVNDMYASLNEFYSLINIPITKMGETLGWSIDKMLYVDFSSVLTEDGRPCLAMDFRVEPMQDYYKLR